MIDKKNNARIRYEKPYCLGPDKRGRKAYAPNGSGNPASPRTTPSIWLLISNRAFGPPRVRKDRM
jgi:hypothetical protein